MVMQLNYHLKVAIFYAPRPFAKQQRGFFMANPLLITESTLTDRYQTTIPASIREALHLGKREKIRYTICSNGNILLSRADQNETDPALDGFLTFLANDIQTHPQRLTATTPELVSRIQNLIGKVDIDIDAPLSDEDE